MIIPDLFSLYFGLYFHDMEFGTVYIGSLLVNESMSYILILHTRIVIINEAKNGIDVWLLLSCSSFRLLINA